MSGIFIHGLGAVSPAGWSMADFRSAVDKNVPLPVQTVTRPGLEQPLPNRAVPPAASRPAFLTHSRLRRATAIAQHAVAAALEAIGGDVAKVQSGELCLGIIVGAITGCVTYSRRFYEEVMREPATASPVIFPETVFNSPASHLAAFLGTNQIAYTLVGDAGTFAQGLALAAEWLLEDRLDACVVIGAEENDWITVEAIKLFQRRVIHGAGAGAVYLKKSPVGALAELAAVTDSFSFTHTQSRAGAARKMRAQLPPAGSDEMLCGSAQNIPRLDEAENSAWKDWNGTRLLPKAILGEAFVAAAAWECVAACDAIARGKFSAANVSIVGANQQAIGARFSAPK